MYFGVVHCQKLDFFLPYTNAELAPLWLRERHSPWQWFLSYCVYSHATGCGEVDKFLCSAHKDQHKAAFWIDHSCCYLKHLPEKCSLPQASCMLHGETGTLGRWAEVRLNVTSAHFLTYFCSAWDWDLAWNSDVGPWHLSNQQHYHYLSTESTLRLKSPHLMQGRGLLF